MLARIYKPAQNAMQEAGLPVRADWVFDGDFSMPSGEAAGRAFLNLTERPTAVFSANDEMAVGFLSVLRHAGVECPRDLSVVGFDDIDIAEQFIPALTTVRQPRIEIGETAAAALIALIRSQDKDGETAVTQQILVAELAIRDSTRAIA
jgi:LacI family repressor for deo operon, udp, cdd, tsx, nupC, and nupG